MRTKLRRSYVAVIVVLVISFCLWHWVGGGGRYTIAEFGSEKSIFSSKAPILPGKKRPHVAMDDPRWKIWDEMERADSGFQWKMPIRFYGIVLDENSQPIENAVVKYEWNPIGDSKEAELKTGGDGSFRIEGIRGKVLGVRVSKNGYNKTTTSYQAFEYAAFFEPHFHEPDPRYPVKFRLAKKLTPQQLTICRASGSIRYGEKFYYDLTTARVTPRKMSGSVLAITVERTVGGLGEHFDWSATLEVPEGGLQEGSLDAGMLAPSDGYGSQWRRVFLGKSQDFSLAVEGTFFARTRHNRYARIQVTITNPGLRTYGPGLTLKTYLNESGSRNLEEMEGAFSIEREIKSGDIALPPGL